jgi:Protein of unknown function (DUF2752)
MLPCVSKKIFGVDCLGCGAQRAFLLVLKGEFHAAFIMFPAIYTTILFILFAILLLVDKKQRFFAGKLNYHKMVVFLAISNALIMIISYIYKHFLI